MDGRGVIAPRTDFLFSGKEVFHETVSAGRWIASGRILNTNGKDRNAGRSANEWQQHISIELQAIREAVDREGIRLPEPTAGPALWIPIDFTNRPFLTRLAAVRQIKTPCPQDSFLASIRLLRCIELAQSRRCVLKFVHD
jgi:hypothetical protein